MIKRHPGPSPHFTVPQRRLGPSLYPGRVPRIRALSCCLALAVATPVFAAEMVTHLFTSWYGVEAGTTVFKVNRNRLKPESAGLIDQVRDYYKIELADGDTPPERVSVPTGVKVRAEVATKTAQWFVADQPWESGGVGLIRLVHDHGLYRVWYYASSGELRDKVMVLPNGRKKLTTEGEVVSALCYMESRDAVNWVKPHLGLVEFRGSKENNIVSLDPRIRGPGGMSIFIDPSAPPAERYKTTTNLMIWVIDPNTKLTGARIAGAVSPDGLRWTPIPEPLTSTSNNDGGPDTHYEEQTGKYVQYMRSNYTRRRSISRAETRDFRHWPDSALILTPGPDEDPSTDYYSNTYVRYPGAASTHLMLVSAYHRDTSLVDVQLATSMDGDAWNWLSPRSVVQLGRPGDWDGGMLWICGDMVRLPDGRAAVPLMGGSTRHEESWREKFESGYVNIRGIAWATWEDGRIAGIEAEKTGEFTTLPMKATGQPIEVNVRTGQSGFAQVDVLVDTPGRAVPELALRAKPLTGDLGWQTLALAEKDLAPLANATIRLRFHLFDAKVFGVRGAGLEWVSTYSRK